MKNVVIIGNGVAGITAARHIRKLGDHTITVVSSETKYFYSRTALMYIYMGHMKFEHTQPYENWFWEKNHIDLLHDYVERVDVSNKTLHLRDSSTPLNYDFLILATGSKSNQLDIPGMDATGVQGLYHYQDLEQMEHDTKGIQSAVVVGGGLIGIEMVEMLRSRGIEVTFLVREKSYWDIVLPHEESDMINRHIREHHVDLRLGTELSDILTDGNGKVSGVKTSDGSEISCQFAGITVGVQPNIDFIRNAGIEINRGILVDEYLQTSAPDVFAIGDCAEIRDPLPGRRAIEPVWYTGRMMGETVAHSIVGQPVKYEPGVWFNSAKFFDIEYQTYGYGGPVITNDQGSVYWEHADGRKCLRLIYEEDSGRLLGINALGIRLRHELAEEWISNGLKLKKAIQQLADINFDPEFFEKIQDGVIEAYNLQFPDDQVSKKGSGVFTKILGF